MAIVDPFKPAVVDPFKSGVVDPFAGRGPKKGPEVPSIYMGQGMGSTEGKNVAPSLDEIDVSALREYAVGASFGASDELEAGARALLDRMQNGDAALSSDEYFRDIQKERSKFSEGNPWTAIGLQVAGGLMSGAPVSKALGIGNSLGQAIARQGAAGAIEGGVYGFMEGGETLTTESIRDRLDAAGKGALIGGLIGVPGGAIARVSRPSQFGGKSEETTEKLRKILADVDPVEQYSTLQQRMYQKAMDYRMRGAEGEGVVPGPNRLARETAEELGLDINQMAKLAKKDGGWIDFNTIDAIEMAEGAMGQFSRTAKEAAEVAMRSGKDMKFTLDNFFAPIKRLMRDHVGVKYAAWHNRAQNRAMRQAAEHHDGAGRGVEEIRKFLDQGSIESLELRRLLLNMANDSADDGVLARELIAKKFGPEGVQSFERYMQSVEGLQSRYHNAVDSTSPVTKGWLHTQKLPQRDPDAITPDVRANAYNDRSAKRRTRPYLETIKEAADYENPLRTMDNWVDDHLGTINTFEIGNLRPAGRVDMKRPVKSRGDNAGKSIEKESDIARWKKKELATDYDYIHGSYRGGYTGRAIREKLEAEGYDEKSISNAIELAHNVLYDANKSPGQIIRAVRDLGYAGTIFNPGGAVLNLHDVFNSASVMGIRNAMGSIFQKTELGTKDLGLARQYMGEYVKQLGKLSESRLQKVLGSTEKLSEKSATWSGFRRMDQWGKDKIVQMSINEGRRAIRMGNFDEQWQHTFSAPEREQIKRDLAEGDMTDLVKELAMFRLSQIQPINAAQQTRFSLGNPNWRIAYMLKNYAIRQLDFFRTNAIDEWKAGNKAKAALFAAKYATYSGGGYALIDEARRPLMGGEEPDFSPENLATKAGRQLVGVATIGVAGSGDYSWDKFWDNPAKAFKEGLLPPTNILEAVYKDAGSLLEGDPPEEILKNLPVVGKTFFKPLLDS